MEQRQCKSCHSIFDVDFATQRNCRACKEKAMKHKRAVRAQAREQKIEDVYAKLRPSNLHYCGEETPGRNATNHAAELAIHRECLRSMGQVDIQHGETLRQVAKRCYESWVIKESDTFGELPEPGVEIYVNAFDRKNQRFDKDWGYSIIFKPFDQVWVAPKKCKPGPDEPIDLATLPELPKLSAPVAPTPAPEPEPAPVIDPTEKLLERILTRTPHWASADGWDR